MLWVRDGPSVVWVLVAANLFVAAMYQGRNHRQGLDGSDWLAGATNTLQAPGASPLPIEKRAGYTIVLNTFRRNACLKEALDHWMKCEPAAVHVVWPDPESPLPDYAASYDADIVKWQRWPGTNLTYRFHPTPFHTDAVFSVDDDTTYTCDAMAIAFAHWQKAPADAMVGFAPRKMHPDGGYWNAEAHRRGVFNTLFVTKGAFLHNRFYHMYFAPEVAEARALVDSNITAEDILMSSIYARDTRRLPTVIPVTEKQYHTLRCGNDLVGKAGFPSPEQRRKVIANQIWDIMGSCEPSRCACNPTGGKSSADCKCDVPGLGSDHGQTERCGYPFTFGDGNGFVNQETGLVEFDPKGCKGEISEVKAGGCFDGMFI